MATLSPKTIGTLGALLPASPLVLTWAVLATPVAATAPVLQPAMPIAGELIVGEARLYQANLTAGDPWLLTVEQRDIDVVVEVMAPDGSPLAAVDSPFDRQGTETLLVEPEVAGSYRVEVRSREPAAPPGRYEIRLDPLPDANPEDQHRLAAERAVTTAARHYFLDTAEARREAIVRYREALPHWRALGRDREAARTLYAIAVLHRLLNDTEQALASAREVLVIWQTLGDRLWEAFTLNEMGLDLDYLGQSQEARSSFEQAFALHDELGERFGAAMALGNLCLMDLKQGELRAGVACYERAFPLLHEVQAAQAAGAAHINMGRGYDLLGEPQKARDHYQQALALMRSIGDRKGEASTLNNLAVLYRELDENEQALGHYAQALDLFRELRDRRWQARVLNNLGYLYRGLGEMHRALAYYRQAVPLWREVGDPKGHASTVTNLAQVLSLLGEHQEALELSQQALALRRATEDRRGEATALSQLGQTYEAMGELAAAREPFAQALELLRAVGDRPTEAAVLRRLGRLDTELGQPRLGLESLNRALEIARAVGHRTNEAQTRYEMARAQRLLGRAEEARAEVEAVLEIAETLRTRITNPELRSSYSSMEHGAYELYIDLLMEAHHRAPAAGHDQRALEASERARARGLVELLHEAGADIREGVEPALLKRRTALVHRLNAKADRALRGELPAEAFAAEQLEILHELDVVEAEIREHSPGYAALTRPQPLGATEIRDLLDPDTLLLSYALGEARSFLWAVTANAVASFELPGRAEIESAARELHQQLATFDIAARRSETRAAAALSQLILGPVADRLDGQRLAVVADGALHYLPFAALPLPPQGEASALSDVFVVERHEVVYLPSASALAVQRRIGRGRPPAPKWLAVLADPVFEAGDERVAGAIATSSQVAVAETSPPPALGPLTREGFERLRATRREADAIAALAPPGEVLKALDFAANRSRVLGDELLAYRVIHFATHGVIDTEHPALSGLALSLVDVEGRPQEGFLHLHDVYHLRLAADLVVLSGCRTALGREIRGEGLVGLTRGFMYAGSPRVVASLWRVEDRATAALMTRFYRAMWTEGLRPSAALRSAQRDLRGERRWRDPTFWAGFVLLGDWR